MKEKDILWESDCKRLYIASTQWVCPGTDGVQLGYTVFLNGATHARSTITCGKLKDAIQNGEAFAKKSTSYIEKFCW